ncbi:MAG: beta-ketoacyl synthase N-terminal-like domain-containing protein [Hyphomicrobiaceae bacterium]|nr:beta-ketoacyl synthase N-terminal-like domain-containing protein [Hyphomicrobiaceae bacterium]
MTDTAPDPAELSPVKRALLEIRELKARLRSLEEAAREPVAIVGTAMRLPGGVRDAEGFARLLWSGTDAVTEIPETRWPQSELFSEDPDAPGKLVTRFGAFVDGIDSFDAEFFGISPREAASMDPQQRILLETCWHALEDAGIAPGSLRGTRTGVYLGISNGDYGRALLRHPELIDTYVSTGNAYSVAAGRLSYVLGIHGPSIAIDTACSSSLVAIHLAIQGLRNGECDLAVAGGINLVLTPEMNISFSKARMMAPDGRCKTFDAAADGYVRGEGCGLVVLRRLSEAIASGERVLGIIRGSAVNQDGRSGGLTAPNGPAQEAVLRAALENAGVAPRSVGYVEAHGTGTPLGDPIEVGALCAVLCADRTPESRLLIGSVKTNIGHLEAAAGVAGVLKVVAALARREIPPNLHFGAGNPHIDWQTQPIAVPTGVVPWAPIDGRRIAGVSSFGFSGTNAHLVIEEAPPAPLAPRPVQRPMHLLALSARHPEALDSLARGHLDTLATAAPDAVADICTAAACARSHFPHRIAVTGASAADLRRGLDSFLARKPDAALAAGHVDGVRTPRVAFLFTGQGAQHARMGLALYDTSPVFRQALDACARGLEEHMPRGLLDVLAAPEATSPVNDTAYAQPATFAVEYALACLWRSWGVEPALVLGHSLGEYAAACVAGAIPLADALALVAARGRLGEELANKGAMAAVMAPEDLVVRVLEEVGGALSIAAYNGPAHQVVSGPPAAVDAALARFTALGVEVKRLRVPFAAHSAFVEAVLPAFGEALSKVCFAPPQVAVVSNVTGSLARPGEIERPEYWLTHLRQPVRFAQSVATLQAHGITHCIEIGPHPVLLGMAAGCMPGADVEWLPSLRRNREDWSDLVESVGRLYVGGVDIDWKGFAGAARSPHVDLPVYPFRRVRHWQDVVGPAAATATPIDAAARWTRMSAALDRQSEMGPVDLAAATYPEKWASLERLTTAHAIATLREAGLFGRAGEERGLDDVLGEAGIDGRYARLVRRWLDRIAAAGHLAPTATGWVAPGPLPDPGLEAAWQEAERRLADNQPLLAYIRHCGSLLARVLRGQESPLETLFPGGAFELAEGLYERSATMRYINALAAAGLQTLAAATPPGRTLRILEIGAGTGGTTSSLLPVLPASGTQYLFSDVSDLFLERARTRFAAFPFVRTGRLDIDHDIAAQGFAPASFDVIVAANAVHASADLGAALQRLRALLAPGGVLLLVESTTHFAWFDMTTGLIEGWQHFTDGLRGDDPLLPAHQWQAVLREAGFAEAEAWPRDGRPAAALGQHVIAARVAGEVAARPVADLPSAELAPVAAIAAPVADDLRAGLAACTAGERAERLEALVRERVMHILKLGPDAPPSRHDRLMELGFDSLMAVQLRNALTRDLGLAKPLAASVLFDHPTIASLGAHLSALLAPAPDPVAVEMAPPAAAAPVALGSARVAAMSDEEIAKMLLQKLGAP